MIIINVFESNDYSGKPKEPDFLSVFHRVMCVFGTIITAHYLLMCVFSLTDALHDMRKFEGLGFSYSFSHYLMSNSFPEAIGMALPVAVEFLLFVILYRRKEQKNSYWGGISYFSILLVFHAVIWLYANSLDFPEYPPYITADGMNMRHYIFAGITMLQSIIYFILYLLRVRSLRSEATSRQNHR